MDHVSADQLDDHVLLEELRQEGYVVGERLGYTPVSPQIDQRRNRNFFLPNNVPFQRGEVYLCRFMLTVPVVKHFTHHWGLVVVDTDLQPWIYEIDRPKDKNDNMSESTMRCKVTKFHGNYRGSNLKDVFFMGFTAKSHDWIETWMKKYTSNHTYNPLTQNCHDMCKDLLKDLKLANEQRAPNPTFCCTG